MYKAVNNHNSSSNIIIMIVKSKPPQINTFKGGHLLKTQIKFSAPDFQVLRGLNNKIQSIRPSNNINGVIYNFNCIDNNVSHHMPKSSPLYHVQTGT